MKGGNLTAACVSFGSVMLPVPLPLPLPVLLPLSFRKRESGGSAARSNGLSEADSDRLRIAYISQQQLKSFNLPYQLGWSNLPEFQGRFESPIDADTGE